MTSQEKTKDYPAAVREAVNDEAGFVRLTFSGKHQPNAPWVKLVVRPVQVKGGRQLQFSYFDGEKDITKNYTGGELQKKLDEALAMPFRYLHLHTTSGDLNVRISKKDKTLTSWGKPSLPEAKPAAPQNREKQQPLAPILATDLLQALEIADKTGQVRPTMQGKLNQINQFLRLMEQSMPKGFIGSLDVIDCGCGSAYLTFAAYQYFHYLKGLDLHITGIDADEELIAKCNRLRDEMGWDALEFRVSKIADFKPDFPTDLTLSLHACDTATDEAIAQGVRWGSQVILAAPCCQHELHDQLKAPLFHPVLRHGILKERLADILTDGFHAQVLRILGYRAEVIEFISPEHTSKNLLIRAKKGAPLGDKAAVQEYLELKRFWEVEPAIERLLAEQLRPSLGDSS